MLTRLEVAWLSRPHPDELVLWQRTEGFGKRRIEKNGPALGRALRTFDLIDEAEGFYGGDYYICDLATDLTHDRRRIASRLKKVRFLSGPIVVERAATFTDYREFATRFIHYFQIKTCNVLLKVEATINNLDWQGESPTPIYGYLHFHGSDRALRKDFDSIVKSEFKEAAAFSIRRRPPNFE